MRQEVQDIAVLQDTIKHHYSQALVRVDEVLPNYGLWFIDIFLGRKHIVVRYSLRQGKYKFGVTSIKPNQAFIEHPDESLATVEEVVGVITQMLEGNYRKLQEDL